MPSGTDRPKAVMGGKKLTMAGKFRAASEPHIAPSAYTVIRDEKGEPTGLTRPMPDEKPGAFAGLPVKVKQVDLAQPASFQEGGVVKKSGWAQVEKGERIMPSDETEKAAESQQRGRLAASMKSGSPEQRKYIAAQGEAESEGGSRLQLPLRQSLAESTVKSETMRDQALAKPANFKKGGTVKKSGWAKVEKGEKVIPKEKAMADEKRDRTKSAMGGKGKKKSSKGGSKKKVHKMHIRHAKNGGYIVEHEFKGTPGEPAPESEEHTAPDMDALQDHVAEHMAPPQEEQPAAGGAPPPPAAAGGPPAGAPPPQGM